MAFEMLIFAVLVAFCNAGLLPVDQHHHHGSAILLKGHDEHIEHHAPANYQFEYSVHDSHTGDVKSQHEIRHGDNVQGQYSLIEPDGSRRTVDYSADAHNGFNAQVTREGLVHHPGKIAVAAHSVAAPHVISHVSAPIASIANHHNDYAIAQHAHALPVVAQQHAHHALPVVAQHAHHLLPVAQHAHHVLPVASVAQHHHIAPVATISHSSPIAYAGHGIPSHSASIVAPALTHSVHHVGLTAPTAHLASPVYSSSHTVHHHDHHDQHLGLYHH